MRPTRTSDELGAGQAAAVSGEAGFTLIEAMISVVVLVFGLIAVTNLLVVAGTQNRVAGDSTVAANVAQQQLETLRATPFLTLKGQVGTPQTAVQDVPGAGQVDIAWTVQEVDPSPGPAGQAPVEQVLFIQLRAEVAGPLSRARSRAEYTVFRACTNTIVPGC